MRSGTGRRGLTGIPDQGEYIMENRAVSIMEIIRRPTHYSAELVGIAIESMPALLRSMQNGRQNGAASFIEDWSAPSACLLADVTPQRCYVTLTLEE